MPNPSNFDLIIIGGGASGIFAAISAKRKGLNPVICERMPQIGKKILASGGGRCNFLNEDLSEFHYGEQARALVRSVFSRFGKKEIKDFFEDLGLKFYSEDGKYYPVTNQASTVLKVLEIELKRLSIRVETNFEVTHINAKDNTFEVISKGGKRLGSGKVLLAGGGRSYPALGSDGSSYKFAKQFGHTIVEPVPNDVPLVVKDLFCHFLQGQRITSAVMSIIDGKVADKASGELLFTKYGLSGTAIIDISKDISIAINRLRKSCVEVSVDLVPFIDKELLRSSIEERIKKGIPNEDLLAGYLPNKFSLVFRDLFKGKSSEDMVKLVKDKRFKILGTRGWNEADFTAGGVGIKEVNTATLESKLKSGLYFAGEILDIEGERGGYNLSWAWASGYIAGLN